MLIIAKQTFYNLFYNDCDDSEELTGISWYKSPFSNNPAFLASSVFSGPTGTTERFQTGSIPLSGQTYVTLL